MCNDNNNSYKTLFSNQRDKGYKLINFFIELLTEKKKNYNKQNRTVQTIHEKNHSNIHFNKEKLRCCGFPQNIT